MQDRRRFKLIVVIIFVSTSRFQLYVVIDWLAINRKAIDILIVDLLNIDHDSQSYFDFDIVR